MDRQTALRRNVPIPPYMASEAHISPKTLIKGSIVPFLLYLARSGIQYANGSSSSGKSIKLFKSIV